MIISLMISCAKVYPVPGGSFHCFHVCRDIIYGLGSYLKNNLNFIKTKLPYTHNTTPYTNYIVDGKWNSGGMVELLCYY